MPPAPSIVFRTDSGAVIGSGHLVRCQTLADELRRRGARVRFVCRDHLGHLGARLETAGYPVHYLSAPAKPATHEHYASWLGDAPLADARDTRAALQGPVDWLITDHYGIDAQWESAMRGAAARRMAIDDLADRRHDVDLLLDQNFHGARTPQRYQDRLPQDCRALLGPRYALLQPVYRELRAMLPVRDGTVRRVLVFFGAHDPTQSALTLLRVLAEGEFSTLGVDVVPGNDPALNAAVRGIAAQRPGIQVHESLPSLAALMTRADLACGAAGSSTWERACLGVPTLLAVIAANQAPGAQALAAENFVILAGEASRLDAAAWRDALRSALRDPSLLAGLDRRSRQLTDGFGAARVASMLSGDGGSALRLRAAHAGDEALLLDWTNDAGVRAQSFSRAAITAEQHHAWYRARLADHNTRLLIGEDSHGLPLGQLRFEHVPGEGIAFVHISVDAVARGRGIGAALLRAGLRDFAAHHGDITVVAEILENNTASQRMFAACGFEAARPRRAGAVAYEFRIRGVETA